MAIDTRNKRASVLGACLLALTVFPSPASTQDSAWRMHVAGDYSFSAHPPRVPDPPGFPTVGADGGGGEPTSKPERLYPQIHHDDFDVHPRRPETERQPVDVVPRTRTTFSAIHADDEEVFGVLLEASTFDVPERQVHPDITLDDDDAFQLILEEV